MLGSGFSLAFFLGFFTRFLCLLYGSAVIPSYSNQSNRGDCPLGHLNITWTDKIVHTSQLACKILILSLSSLGWGELLAGRGRWSSRERTRSKIKLGRKRLVQGQRGFKQLGNFAHRACWKMILASTFVKPDFAWVETTQNKKKKRKIRMRTHRKTHTTTCLKFHDIFFESMSLWESITRWPIKKTWFIIIIFILVESILVWCDARWFHIINPIWFFSCSATHVVFHTYTNRDGAQWPLQPSRELADSPWYKILPAREKEAGFEYWMRMRCEDWEKFCASEFEFDVLMPKGLGEVLSVDRDVYTL